MPDFPKKVLAYKVRFQSILKLLGQKAQSNLALKAQAHWPTFWAEA